MDDAKTQRRRLTLVFLAVVVVVAVSILGVADWASSRSAGRSPRTVMSAPRATAGSTPVPTAHPAAWVRAENARPGNADWAIPPRLLAADNQLAGYADMASAVPGATVRLFVSAASPRVRVRAYRVGAYRGAHARLVWSSEPFATTTMPGPMTDPATRMVHAAWPATTSVSTSGWPEGLYLLKLIAVGGKTDGRQRYIPLVVRSTSTAGRLVLVSATATQAAYNTWGGRSLYGGGPGAKDFAQRSYAVSLDRPYDGDGIRKLAQYELGPIWEAESLGLDLAYLTSADLERPAALSGARGVVSLGHDEYWTIGMRRAVEAARDAGTNVAFLGANTAYWRVRFASSPLGVDREVVGYKDAALDPLARTAPAEATTRARSGPGADPENSLTGTLYECFPARGDYVVSQPSFALFSGTGVRAGTRIPGLVGAEIDRAYPIAGTPASVDVVSHSPVQCGKQGRTFADSVYFTSPSGAGTFSTGTMSWSLALRGPSSGLGLTPRTVSFTRRVTANLFRAMAAGPMGRSIPATANLASLHENPSARTGTGGPVTGPAAG